MRLDELRVAVCPGEGMVARFPSVLVVAASPGWPAPRLVAALLEACRASITGSGQLVDRLAAIAADSDGAGPCSFCVLVEGDDGLSILVHGDIQVSIRGGQSVFNLMGHEGPVWTVLVPDLLAAVAIGKRNQFPGGRTPEPWLNLVDGVVGGSGVVMVPIGADHGVAPPPASADAPIAPPPASADATPSDPEQPWGAGGSADPPMVWGRRCKAGHFNHPEARYCGICGTHMVHGRRDLVLGPRPVIGFLVLDDGSTYKLDSDYLLGATPEVDLSVRAGTARGMALTDDQGTVSALHARIRLEEWEVYVSDEGSRFGTHVWMPGKSDWVRLEPGQRLRLEPRSHVLLGRRRVVFEPIS
ncbi:MAG: FHA domain-containing protein [Acidimicrobiales bacterium]